MRSWTRRRALALAAASAALIAAPAGAGKPFKLVMLGDSLTAGYGVRAEEAIPAQIEAALKAQGYDVRVINAGVSGDTTEGGLARLDFSVGKDADGVLVGLGGNDMMQGRSPGEVRANLAAIVKRLKARKLPVALLGMRGVSNFGAAQQRAFDAVYPGVAKAAGVRLYPFILDGVAGDPRLMQGDGIHPNAAGARLVGAKLAAFVAKAFALKRTPG